MGDVEVAFGAATNVIVFGAVIWGALARTTDRRRRLQFALGVPVAFNGSLLLFKGGLTMDQRVWGAVATVVVCAAAIVWFRRQSFNDS